MKWIKRKNAKDLEKKTDGTGEAAKEEANVSEGSKSEIGVEGQAEETGKSETKIENPEVSAGNSEAESKTQESGTEKTETEIGQQEAKAENLEDEAQKPEAEREKPGAETEKSEGDMVQTGEETVKQETTSEGEKKEPAKKEKAARPLKKIDPRNMIIGMAVVVLSLVLIACIYFAHNVTDSISAQAVVEAPVVTFVSPVQGIVLDLLVEEGDWVTSGSPLAVLDSEIQEKALEALEKKLEKDQEALAELLKGPDPKVVASAEESVANAQKSYDTAASDFKTADATYKAASASYDGAIANRDALKTLYEEEAISEADYQNAEQAISDALTIMREAEKNRENTKKNYDMAQTRLGYAKDILAEIKAGPDPNEVKAVQDTVAETQEQIDYTKNEIEQYTLRADCDGIVMKINQRKGDIVAVGYKVFEIALQDEAYLSAFLPEADLKKIELGQKVRIKANQQEYEGIVTEIGEEPETAPSELENLVNLNHGLYRVTIETEGIRRLIAGELVEAVFPFHQKETGQ